MTPNNLPRYIALCGVPKSGKSLVQEILRDNYGVQPIDDGAPLRDFAQTNLGATHAQVHAQEGKASLAFWPNGDPIIDVRTGEHLLWREVLGLIGNQYETMFGPNVMPMMALARLADRGGSYSFGSVRRKQGQHYKANGGVIVEVINPLAKPTGNEFDEYDRTIVDYELNNDALARGMAHKDALADLQDKVHALVLKLTVRKAA